MITTISSTLAVFPIALNPQVLAFALVVIGYVGQTLLNNFANSDPNAAARRAANQFLKEEETKRKREPNKAPIPVPPYKKTPPDKKNVVIKKVNQDPVADKVNNQDPTPTNDDAPRKVPQRIIPPVYTPGPINNQTPTQTPLPNRINVKKPPLFEHTGKLIYQPIEDIEVNLYSMPVAAAGRPDYTEVVQAQNQTNKIATYLEFLATAKAGDDIGKYKLSDIIPVFIGAGANIDSDPALVIGTEALGKLSEAYENYSDGFLSDPIFTIPSVINIKIIKGVDNSRKRRLPPEIDNNLKPDNPEIKELTLDNSLFKIPKNVTPEKVLEFAGNASTFAGGAEKWEEYKKNPNAINNPEFFKVPTSSDLINETVDPDAPAYQSQKLKVDSMIEYLTLLAGTLYTKIGLHEFPSDDVPGVKNLAPLDPPSSSNPNPNNQTKKSDTALKMGSLAGGLAYITNWFDKKLGDFPAEIEVPDSQNPDKQKKEQVNVSTALTSLLTIGSVGVALTNFGNNINLQNAGEIEAAKNAALKSQECACSNLANSGMNTTQKSRCSKQSFNFTSAKGFDDMLKGATGCYDGVENQDSTTIKDMLQNIMFGVNIIKGAFFKGEKELKTQEKVIEDLLKGRINKDKLDDFIDDFNNQKTPVTKEYPIQPKIIKEPKTGGNP